MASPRETDQRTGTPSLAPSVPVNLRPPSGLPDGTRAPGALLCPTLSTVSDAAGDLLDALSEALLNTGFGVLAYRPLCDQLIQEEYNAYDFDQSVTEAAAAFEQLAASETVDPERISIIGYGISAITVIALIARLKQPVSLVLLNPDLPSTITRHVEPDDETSPGAIRPSAGAADERLPREYLRSVVKFDPIAALRTFEGPALILEGAACAQRDGRAPGATYAEALHQAERPVTYLQVAGAGLTFDEPAERSAALTTIIHFLRSTTLRPATRA